MLHIRTVFALSIIVAAALIINSGEAKAQGKTIIIQSTTSTANSGLYDQILPAFHQASGIRVNVVAVGTGQAIKNAKNCDGDVLLVHAKTAEEEFVQAGFGVKRFDVMYNDFIIVGPKADPANIRAATDVTAALKKIAATKGLFASRGDNSGTHKAELRLWHSTNVDPKQHSGTWYRQTGSGMGATLNIAVGMRAYTMTDRGTWISFKNKSDFEILVEGDERLFNQYGVILVNPDKCPNVDKASGQSFVDWIIGKEGQAAINAYQLGSEQLFFPNAKSHSGS